MAHTFTKICRYRTAHNSGCVDPTCIVDHGRIVAPCATPDACRDRQFACVVCTPAEGPGLRWAPDVSMMVPPDGHMHVYEGLGDDGAHVLPPPPDVVVPELPLP